MERDQVAAFEQQIVEAASGLFGVDKDGLKAFAAYEGCANLVYEYERQGQPLILRVSYHSERTALQIQAELDFVNYLADHQVRVSRPVLSQNGRFLETVRVEGMPLHVVSFVKGKGMRVPDNEYRYREDAPIEEYFQNWGRVLGQMHALAQMYQPRDDQVRRPTWFELHRSRLELGVQVADRLPVVSERIQALIEEIRALPEERDAFGLIHGDFNDGNFTVDYSNGDITVFDFDDSCYFWFAYELAAAWEGGIGRVMFRGLEDRQAFMDHYMDQVMEGYSQENHLSDEWMARLPLFIKLIQVEEFLHYAQYIDGSDVEMEGHMTYKIKCIEEEIPYMGFFDSIYSPERPFAL